jgi:hypothetical protein
LIKENKQREEKEVSILCLKCSSSTEKKESIHGTHDFGGLGLGLGLTLGLTLT